MTTDLVKSKAKRAAVKNRLKGHDKTGTGKRSRLMFATMLIRKAAETSSGIRGKISVFPSSRMAFNAMLNFYKEQGYNRVGNRELQKEGGPILVLPKKSKMLRVKQGKSGRAMSRGARSGIIL